MVELYSSSGDGVSINELMIRQGLLKPTAEKFMKLVPENTGKTAGNRGATEAEEQGSGETPAVSPPLGEPGKLTPRGNNNIMFWLSHE